MADLSAHARHDRFGIAAAVDGARAPITVRTCQACGALYADLIDLRHAIRHAWTPARVRDLRLSVEEGTRLRSGGWVDVLEALRSARAHLSRPLALGFATLGVVGLLVSTPNVLSLGSMSAGASAEATMDVSVAGAPGASAAASIAPAAASVAPVVGAVDQPIDVSRRPTVDPTPPDTPARVDRSAGLFWLSIGFLLLGAGLFGLHRSSRRQGVG